MNENYLAEIILVSFNFPPKGWALCNGQLLPINQNQALFALLGTTYGGNGQTNFALPNFQGRIPIHVGNGHTLGEAGGSDAVTLNTQQLSPHTHRVTPGTASMKAGVGPADQTRPDGNYFAQNDSETRRFSNRADSSMANVSPVLDNAGGSQPHSNMQPYLVLNYIIALQGVFPSQN